MLLRGTLIFGPAIVLPRLAAFLVVLILTHSASTSEFGLYALVLLVGEALDMTASSWIRIALLRLDISKATTWRDGFRRSYVLSLVSTAIACCLAVATATVLVPDHVPTF